MRPKSTVAAYSDDGDMPPVVIRRLLDVAIAAGADSSIQRFGLETSASTAAGLRRDLGSGADHGQMLRRIRELVSNVDQLDAADWDLFSAEPPTTGHRGWDAALAGAVDWCADRLGMQRPTWTAHRNAEPWLFVGSTKALHAYAFAFSPPQFSFKGVFLDPDDLVTV
ncbi:MAG: hypothetical protein KDB86_07490 [Actinobacteria bacterium]|nr:hypothetical protein [Actinomycetota bacterium]MCB9389697.1 hypothetical protein [Acidimicrobiia bacterium]